MKNLVVLLLIITCLTSFITKKKNGVKQIKILKVPMRLHSPVNVECSDFESFGMPYNYKTFVIENGKDIDMILGNVKVADDYSMQGFDARVKMYIYYESGKTDTLCFCSTKAFYYNNKVKRLKSRILINFLDSLPYNPKDINGM